MEFCFKQIASSIAETKLSFSIKMVLGHVCACKVIRLSSYDEGIEKKFRRVFWDFEAKQKFFNKKLSLKRSFQNVSSVECIATLSNDSHFHSPHLSTTTDTIFVISQMHPLMLIRTLTHTRSYVFSHTLTH